MKKVITVAIAIIYDKDSRVLITQRPMHISHGGFWEFPGGKLEEQEQAEQALRREIKEEIGIDIIQCEFLGEVIHQYVDRIIHLNVFFVSQFEGEAHCRESQIDLRWINIKELEQYTFPEANDAVIGLIRQYLRTYLS